MWLPVTGAIYHSKIGIVTLTTELQFEFEHSEVVEPSWCVSLVQEGVHQECVNMLRFLSMPPCVTILSMHGQDVIVFWYKLTNPLSQVLVFWHPNGCYHSLLSTCISYPDMHNPNSPS